MGANVSRSGVRAAAKPGEAAETAAPEAGSVETPAGEPTPTPVPAEPAAPEAPTEGEATAAAPVE